MKPLVDNFTVVIVGLWNINIFTPEWLKNNLFEINNEEKLLIELPINGFGPTRFSYDKEGHQASKVMLTYVQTLVFICNELLSIYVSLLAKWESVRTF